jgi:hypothetical protein
MPVEHSPKELIAKIIMPLTDGKRPRTACTVGNERFQGPEPEFYIFPDNLFGPQRHQPAEELIEAVAFPPPIHERFPQTDAPIPENPFKKLPVSNANIPGIGTVDDDSSGMKNLLDNPLKFQDIHNPLAMYGKISLS